MKKSVLVAIALLLLIIIPDGITAGKGITGDIQSAEVEPGVVIIKFKPAGFLKKNMTSTGIVGIDQVLKRNGITVLTRVFQNETTRGLFKSSWSDWRERIYYGTIEGNHSPVLVAKALSENEAIAYAEPKYRHFIFDTAEEQPNDSLYSLQTFFSAIKAPDAWINIRGGMGNEVIAVVDGGTQITHEDLKLNIWNNTNEIPGNGVDDDQNGYIDDVNGWNFANNTGDPTGLPTTVLNANHGTHTGGLISAQSDNSIGVAGTSWNATLLPVNAGDPNNDNSIRYGYEGILYAAENGAGVISCSWGRGGGASRFEQEVIDQVSALGAVVVAAAGNSNSDLPFYPASYRQVLSVGATNNADQRASFSNYGTRIDLTAPGQSILSTFNLGNYGYASGTSMACPIAAGVVGLVKTKYPEFTGIQAAEQVRVTSDNIDALNPGYAGLLGYGRINAFRAVTETSPSIRLADVNYEDTDNDNIIERGETVRVYLDVINYLESVSNVTLTLTSPDEFVSITSSQVQIPQINTMEKLSIPSFLEFTVSAGTPSGHRVLFAVEINAGNYQDRDYFNLVVMPTYANTEINQIQTTVTNVGRIGFPSFNDVSEGLGFHYKYGPNVLFEGAVIAGTSADRISNAARGLSADSDQDFSISADGDIRIDTPGSFSDQETGSYFEDTRSDNPMNIKIKQESFAWTDAVYDDFILLKYTIYNLGDEALNNFHFGLFFDWDMDGTSYDTNIAAWDAGRRMGYVYDTGSGPDIYAGVSVLTSGGVSYRAIYNDESHSDGPEWGLYDGFTDQEKWQSISGGTAVTTAGPADISFVISAGPFDLPASGSETITFVMAAGDDLEELRTHIDSAAIKWENILPLGIEEKPINPLDFMLGQNYPNPFNPLTNIAFTLPQTEYVELKVYSLLGQEVATIFAGERNAGRHVISWDAGAYASGVYLYRLMAGTRMLTRKMVLLR